MRKSGQNRRATPTVSDKMPAWADGRRNRTRGRSRRIGSDVLLLAVVVAGAVAFAWFGGGREPPVSLGGTLSGAVEHVVDGDTLDIAGQRVRLAGIDAPEWDQTCTDARGASWRCGEAATDMLRAFVQGELVRCQPLEHDRYGRVVAVCRVDDSDLAEGLVASGRAIATDRYRPEERKARNERTGIWAGPFVTPAEWRAGAGRDDGGAGGNPSRFDRFLAWLQGLLPS